MHLFLTCLINLIATIIQMKCVPEANDTNENEVNCRERNRLVTTNKSDTYMLIDAVRDKTIKLECHYCKETDGTQPKIWYKSNVSTLSSGEEVTLGMDSNASLNRVFLDENHSLVIRNITVNDTGFYYCLGLDKQEYENKLFYLIDLVYGNTTHLKKGTLSEWLKYHEEVLVPLNKLYATSSSATFDYIRNKLYMGIQVITEWKHWGPCEVCGRKTGDGQRRKKGYCRIKVTSSANNTPITLANNDEAIFLNASKLSCDSEMVFRLFPEISNVTRFLPQYVLTEKCDGICNPDAEGVYKGWKVGKTKGFKYKKSFVLAENAHLSLACPESTLSNVVKWYKNGKILKTGESAKTDLKTEPKIVVDTFNTLYLHGVSSEDEGNYTCVVDEIRMQQVKIYIVSKSRLLTQVFVRHVIYLAFVLSLTFTCYCAGLFVTWKKRHTFKTYEELRELEDSSEEDDLSTNDDKDSSTTTYEESTTDTTV